MRGKVGPSFSERKKGMKDREPSSGREQVPCSCREESTYQKPRDKQNTHNR